jgi:hypothetical protein
MTGEGDETTEVGEMADVRELAAHLLGQRLVHGVILDSCGPDEVEWEAMTNVVNALSPKQRQVIESIFCDADPSYSVVLGRCRPREAKLIGRALCELFAEYRGDCGGVTLTGPDLSDEIRFSLHFNGNGDWVVGEP